QILLRRLQRKRVDSEVLRVLTHVQVAAAVDVCEGLKRTANVEDVGKGFVLLRVRQQKVAEETFSAPGGAENQGVRDFAIVKVEVIRSVIGRFEHGQVLGTEMRVCLLARKDRKEKRQVGVVRVQQIQLPEVRFVVAGHDGEVHIELVIGLGKELAARVREESRELAHSPVHRALVEIVEDEREGEFAERLTVTQSTQAIAQILNVG